MVWAGISVKSAISLRLIIGTMDMKVSYFVIIVLKLKSAVCQKYNWHSFTNQVYHKLLDHHALPGAKKFLWKVVFSRKTPTPSTLPKCVGIICQEKKNEIINVLYWNNLNELQIQFKKKIIDPYGVATTETWSKPYRASMGLPWYWSVFISFLSVGVIFAFLFTFLSELILLFLLYFLENWNIEPFWMDQAVSKTLCQTTYIYGLAMITQVDFYYPKKRKYLDIVSCNRLNGLIKILHLYYLAKSLIL